MDGKHAFQVRHPGDLTGKKPKSYGKGRRCRCGVSMSEYTKGEWCSACRRNSSRREHYVDLPIPEKKMEPEKMKSKEAADYIGVHVRDLRDLVAEGKIEVIKAGRGLWSSTYDANSVRAYMANFQEPEDFLEDAELAVKDCCGQPDNCEQESCPNEAQPETQPEAQEQSFDEFVAERRAEYDKHVAVHVQAIDRARNASAIYLESIVIGKQAAGDAQRVERELAALGLDMPKTAYAVEPDQHMDADVIAIQKMYDALRDLDRSERARVVSVVIDRYSIA